MISQPYGAMSIVDGSAVTQALTTAAGKVVAWSGTGGGVQSNSGTIDGDPAVKADQANNRMLVLAPGIYLVTVDLSMVGGGATTDVIAQLYKNGVAVADMSGRVAAVSTARGNVAFTGVVTVTTSDNPKTVGSFADPVNPPSKFGGAGGAPLTEVPLEVWLKTASGTITVTFEAGHFTIVRVG